MFIPEKIIRCLRRMLPILLIVSANALMAQVNDSTYVSGLKREVKSDSLQSLKIDSLFKASGIEINLIEKEIQSLSRKQMPDEEKQKLSSELQLKKKAIKDRRESELLAILNEEQKKIYHEKVKPSKPAVLHMGINHDRVNCNVCVKP